MGILKINTPTGIFNFTIEGDTPSLQEKLKIKNIIESQKVPKTPKLSQREVQEQEQFDTTTGIKDAKLRAALSGMENISEQNKTMGAFGFESKDYTRDSRNRLALTPSGAKKMGIETDKNILIDESGFSRYDLADLAGIVPEVGLAVPGAVKGAGIGTAIGGPIGGLIGGALGAAVGGFTGSLAEEAIEGVAGVSDQTAKEILKDAGKEALLTGGGELLFGAPFLVFKGLAPGAGIVKEGLESEAVQSAILADRLGFEPSARQLQLNPLAAKVQSLTESVIGTSPRLLKNRRAMDVQVKKYDDMLKDLQAKSGSESFGEMLIRLSKREQSDLISAQNAARSAINESLKASAKDLNVSVRGGAKVDENLYNAVSDSLLKFEEQTKNMWADIDAVINAGIGNSRILPTDSLTELSTSLLNRYAQGSVDNLTNSANDKAIAFLSREINPDVVGKKIGFTQAYNARQKIQGILHGDIKHLDEDVVNAIRGSDQLTLVYQDALKKFDELLEVTNIESLTKGIKSTKNVGKEGYDLIKKAAEQLEPARKFYFIAKGELDSVASAMESKKILENMKTGIMPEDFSGLALNIVKNDKPASLQNLKYALKRSTGDDKAYGTLRKQIEANWIKSSLKNSGIDDIDPSKFNPSKFLKDLEDLGKTGDELFGSSQAYNEIKKTAQGFRDVKTNGISQDLIDRGIAAQFGDSVQETIENALRISKEVGELQNNKLLDTIRKGGNLDATEVADIVASNGILKNDLKAIMNHFKGNDEAIASIQKHYVENIFNGMGATINSKTLSDMAKRIQLADGVGTGFMKGQSKGKLDMIFDKEQAQSMRDFGKVLEFISKDVGNSDLVANSITANVMGSLGKIARIGIMGQVVSNKRALQQIRDLDKKTRGLDSRTRGQIMANAIGALFRQTGVQTTDNAIQDAKSQISGVLSNSKIAQELSNIRNQANQSQDMFNISQQPGPQPQLPQARNTQARTTQPSITNVENEFQRYNANIRQRAAQNPALAASLLGGLGSAGLLKN
tara:strand:+ start:2120 stop:5182 length:3063 start_codon:yes stop_codon:yes gene_type:complete